MQSRQNAKATRRMRVVLVGVLAACVAAGLAGCSAAPQATQREGCINLAGPGPATPVYLVVDDLVGARPATAVRAGAFATVVQAAFARGAEVVVAVAGSSPGADKIAFSALAVPMGPNPTMQRIDAACAQSELEQAFAIVDRGGAGGGAGPPDVLGALGVLAGDLHSLGGSRVDALVISDPQDGTGALDVGASPQLLAEPAAAARALAAAGRLPDLRGWELTFLVGGGSYEGLQALSALWWHVAAEAGARTTGFEETVLGFPGPPLAAPKTPGVVQLPSPPGTIALEIPDTVLFNTNEATLRPEAEPVLARIAAIMTGEYPQATAVAFGYADARGTAQWNLSLSSMRATSVVSALEGDGVAPGRLRAVGRGASDFVATNTDPAGRALNRRVVVQITTSPGS